MAPPIEYRFLIYSVLCKRAFQPHILLNTTGSAMEPSIGHPSVLEDMLLLNGKMQGKISEPHGHQLIASLLLHYNQRVRSYANWKTI